MCHLSYVYQKNWWSNRMINEKLIKTNKCPNVTCSIKFSDPSQLNYPSFSIVFGNKRVVQYTCVLTNVGLLGLSMKWPSVWQWWRPWNKAYKACFLICWGRNKGTWLPLLREMHSGRLSLNLGQLSRATPKTMLRAQFFFHGHNCEIGFYAMPFWG